MRQRGATSETRVNPNDFSDDPDYGYRPLAEHARRIRSDARRAVGIVKPAALMCERRAEVAA